MARPTINQNNDATYLATETFHVVPNNDCREHDLNKDCWCGPEDDGGFIIHNSADGREDYETGIRRPH